MNLKEHSFPKNMSLYKDLCGFEFEKEIKELTAMHHIGPWIFQHLYDHCGKNFQKNTYPFGNTCLAFELSTQNASLQNGWFILKTIGEKPVLGFDLEFYAKKSYPCTEESQTFSLLNVSIGYHYNHHNYSGFATKIEHLRHGAHPVVNIQGPKFQGWIGRNTNFSYEFFMAELLKNVFLPVSQWADCHFDSNWMEHFRQQYNEKVV